MRLVFDTSKDGYETILKPWQVEAMRCLFERGEEGSTSKDVWLHVLERERISRAAVILFLQRLEEDGVLNNAPRTGKGGYHGFYTPAFDEEGFKLEVARTIISKLLEAFPEAARVAISDVE